MQRKPGFFQFIDRGVNLQIIGAGEINLSQIIIIKPGQFQITLVEHASRQIAFQEVGFFQRTLGRTALSLVSGLEKRCN